MKRLIKKYKWLLLVSILTLIVTLIIGASLFFKKEIKMKEYKGEYYTFSYDSSWKLEEKENKVILNHSSNSNISIDFLLLKDENRYKNLEEMSSQILYDIQKQNSNYHLLTEQKLKITKNYYDGYQMLYENEEKQVLVVIGKDGEKLFILTYESDNHCFDILLDSVESILDNFTLCETIFSISSKLNINTGTILWKENSILEKIDDKVEDSIANYNYIVKYRLPGNLRVTTLDSTMANYRYVGLEENQEINVSISVSPKDIYDYLEDINTITLYPYYQKENVSNYQEILEEAPTEKYNRYIYKRTYQYEKNQYEMILLIYELNRNHTFVVEISSKNTNVPKKWADFVEILSTKNYAGYTDTKKEGDFKVFELKNFKDYHYDKKDIVSIKIPAKWEEITSKQMQSNIYQSRSFGIDYLSKLDYHLYRVDYSFNRTYSKNLSEAISQQVNIEKNSMTYKYKYGKYEDIHFYKKMVFYGNEFYCYKGGYTDSNKVYVDMILLYAATDNSLLKIKVLGNSVKINDSLLKDVTQFSTKEE